ncbi:MAG: ABC transporter permease [Marinoscillum sp.]
MNNHHPPKLLLVFFRWFCHPDYVEDIEGDLLERFEMDVQKNSQTRAKWVFVGEILKLLRPGIMRDFLKPIKKPFFGGLAHYSRIAFRILSINKLITVFSLLCLVVGSVSVNLMYYWVDNETSMNDFHSEKDNVRMLMLKTSPMAKPSGSWTGLNPATDYPEVEKELQVQVYNFDGEAQIQVGDKATSLNLWVVGNTFFDLFDFPMLYGDTATVLDHPHNIILSRGMAEKLFGELDPLGQTVTLLCEAVQSYKVAGVFDDFPPNTSMKFDAVVSNENSSTRWSRMGTNFLLVNNQFDEEEFDEKIRRDARNRPNYGNSYSESEMFTVGLDDIYYGNEFYTNLFSKFGNEIVVRNLKFIAIIILIISAFGFTNLQHIQQLSSSRSLAIRCVNGASKTDLLVEICIGRFYLLIIGAVFSVVLILVIFPYFNQMTSSRLVFDFLLSLKGVILIEGVILIVSLILTLFYIYKLEIGSAFRKTVFMGTVPFVQRSITVVQYAITIILLAASLIAYLQYDFLINKDLGIDTNKVIAVKLNHEMLKDDSRTRDDLMAEYEAKQENYTYALDQLNQRPDILAVSQGEMPVSGSAYPMDHKLVGDGFEFATQNLMTVDPGFKSLLNLEVVQGRFFNDSLDGSRGNKVVLNEAAIQFWGIKDIESVKVKNESWGEFDVIGVVKNFNYESLTSQIKPLVLYYMTDIEKTFLIRLQEGNEESALSYIQHIHDEVNPDKWFEYTYLDDQLKAQYQQELQTMRTYFSFTLVAILLSFTSLFAFAWSETKRKLKEVAIRKVHGASHLQLFGNLGFSFLKLTLVSFIISCPVTWYFMTSWLDDYSYRIEMQVWYFLAAGFVAFLVSFLAVSRQSWTVAHKNPVEVLRYE